MKGTMRKSGTAGATGRQASQKARKRTNERCSICNHFTWFDAVPMMEPVGVAEPRLSWTLCQGCYQALLVEMRRSPVRSPLRLRIAMGLVASERWPQSQSSARTMQSDRKWILFIAWGFVIAMLLHLALIVMLAYIAR